MNIKLGDEHESVIECNIQSGNYQSATEVIRHALRTTFANDYQRLKDMLLLRQSLEITLHQMDNGGMSELSVMDVLDEVLKKNEQTSEA